MSRCSVYRIPERNYWRIDTPMYGVGLEQHYNGCRIWINSYRHAPVQFRWLHGINFHRWQGFKSHWTGSGRLPRNWLHITFGWFTLVLDNPDTWFEEWPHRERYMVPASWLRDHDRMAYEDYGNNL